jgi:hypothetical protein
VVKPRNSRNDPKEEFDRKWKRLLNGAVSSGRNITGTPDSSGSDQRHSPECRINPAFQAGTASWPGGSVRLRPFDPV